MAHIREARRGAAWNQEEDDRLREMRLAGHQVPEIAAALGRPVSSVYLRARRVGTRVQIHKPWSPLEDALLRGAILGGTLANGEIATLLDRGIAAVCARIRVLGLSGKRPRKPAPEAARRSDPEARTSRRTRRRGIPRDAWSAEEIARLKGMAEGGDTTIAEAAQCLGRPVAGTRAKAAQLGLTFPNEARVLHARRNRLIAAAHAEGLSQTEIMARVGASRRTVVGAFMEMGLTKRRRKPLGDSAEIRALAGTHGVTEIARITGRDVRTVKKIAEAEGIMLKAAVRAKPAPGPATAKRAGDPPRKAGPRPAGPARIARPAGPPPAARVEELRGATPPRAAATPRRAEPGPAPVTAPRLSDKAPGKPALDRLAMIRQVAERMRREGRLPAQ